MKGTFILVLSILIFSCKPNENKSDNREVKKGVDFVELPNPDGSLIYFENIKVLSEKYWSESNINPEIFGFQAQNGTKWKNGLSEKELTEFQTELNMDFPEELKNFYRTMNGLDKKGINVFGSDGTEPNYNPIYYSYPEDIESIREKIDWVYKSNALNNEKLENNGIPKIFPIKGHRFLILDDNHQILSMYGDDIIFWSQNISKLIATDIFENIENATDFESNANFAKPVKFWLSE